MDRRGCRRLLARGRARRADGLTGRRSRVSRIEAGRSECGVGGRARSADTVRSDITKGSPAMTPGTRATLVLCARQELAVSVRSRWTQIFAVVFGGLALAVAGSGYVLSGGSGVQDFARTAASLVQIVLLLVPLTSLLLGVMALTPDPGAAELLYSQPVARRTILAGKLIGLFVALTASQAVGFGAAGL